jgi:hypothetical protein
MSFTQQLTTRIKNILPYKWRLGNTRKKRDNKGNYYEEAMMFPFIDARDCQEELDKLGKWEDRYYELNGQIYCEITIHTKEGKISRSDSGDTQYIYLRKKYDKLLERYNDTKNEEEKREYLYEVSNLERTLDISGKEASTDAFKRTCVKFSIGRFLYSMPKLYLILDGYYLIREEDDKTVTKVYKNDNESVSEFCNKISLLPQELIEEIRNAENRDELSKIQKHMYNLKHNKIFNKEISTRWKLLKDI